MDFVTAVGDLLDTIPIEHRPHPQFSRAVKAFEEYKKKTQIDNEFKHLVLRGIAVITQLIGKTYYSDAQTIEYFTDCTKYRAKLKETE